MALAKTWTLTICFQKLPKWQQLLANQLSGFGHNCRCLKWFSNNLPGMLQTDLLLKLRFLKIRLLVTRQKCLLKQFGFFRTYLPMNVQNRKSKHHHQIQHIRISLGFKFHLKQTVLILCGKFAQKCYYRSTIENMYITIKFILFEFA